MLSHPIDLQMAALQGLILALVVVRLFYRPRARRCGGCGRKYTSDFCPHSMAARYGRD